jgi:hypothetical protein
MGVSPYTWPHERKWQPGIHDKRTNLGMWLVLIIYLLFFIGFSLNMGPDLITGELFLLFILLVIVLAGIIGFFLVGQAARLDVKVEEIKYYAVRPERLSQVLMEALDVEGIGYRREGPRQVQEDYWEDALHLEGQHWSGISLVVERNPLIARVDTASVTIRGSSRSQERIDRMKELVDGVANTELLARYEEDRLKDPPELVIYGED